MATCNWTRHRNTNMRSVTTSPWSCRKRKRRYPPRRTKLTVIFFSFSSSIHLFNRRLCCHNGIFILNQQFSKTMHSIANISKRSQNNGIGYIRRHHSVISCLAITVGGSDFHDLGKIHLKETGATSRERGDKPLTNFDLFHRQYQSPAMHHCHITTATIIITALSPLPPPLSPHCHHRHHSW